MAEKSDKVSRGIAAGALIVSAIACGHSCYYSGKNEGRANRMETLANTRDKISMLTRRTELMRILYERQACGQDPVFCPYTNSVYMRSAALKEYIQVVRHLGEDKYLAEVNMNEGQLMGIGMDGFKMSQCHFLDNSYFELAEMSDMCIRYSDFNDGNFNSARFIGSGFDVVAFRGAKLFKTDFTGTRLRDVDFTGAEVYSADFSGAEFSDVDFTDVRDLTQRQLDGACSRGPVTLPEGLSIKSCTETIFDGGSEETSYEDPDFNVCPE